MAADIGKAVVAAGVAIGEPGVVETHLVEDGGVEIVHVTFVLGDGVTVVVGLAIGDAAFEAAAGNPGAVDIRVMSTAFEVGDNVAGAAAKFSGPDDKGFVEHAAGLQIFQKGGNGLVDIFGQRDVRLHVRVGVPVDEDVLCRVRRGAWQ